MQEDYSNQTSDYLNSGPGVRGRVADAEGNILQSAYKGQHPPQPLPPPPPAAPEEDKGNAIRKLVLVIGIVVAVVVAIVGVVTAVIVPQLSHIDDDDPTPEVPDAQVAALDALVTELFYASTLQELEDAKTPALQQDLGDKAGTLYALCKPTEIEWFLGGTVKDAICAPSLEATQPLYIYIWDHQFASSGQQASAYVAISTTPIGASNYGIAPFYALTFRMTESGYQYTGIRQITYSS